VRELIRLDLQKLQVFQDHLQTRIVKIVSLDEFKSFYLLKINFFLGWVCVIKSHDELSLEGLLVVLIQQCSFGMTNVQIPEIKFCSLTCHICNMSILLWILSKQTIIACQKQRVKEKFIMPTLL
jgi:hypothetical protein